MMFIHSSRVRGAAPCAAASVAVVVLALACPSCGAASSSLPILASANFGLDAAAICGAPREPGKEPAPANAQDAKPPAHDEKGQDEGELEKAAAAFVQLLVAGEFDKATTGFDAAMLKALPPARLKSTWGQVTAQAGAYQKQRGTRHQKVKQQGREYDVVILTCEFEKSAVDIRVVFDADRKITGLFTAPARPVFVGKEELWEGTLEIGAVRLRLVIHLGKTADGKPAATLDSIDQGQKGLPFDSVETSDNQIKLQSKSLQLLIEGTFDADRQKLSATFRQAGQKMPILFNRTEKEAQISRPQTPVGPFPYDQHEVTYVNQAADVALAGTLTVPRGKGPFPAAILISGSGAQDRDETLFGHKPFWVLADYLTRRGIAVLRVDDRGVGGSTGSVARSTTADFAADVLSGVAFLKQRKEIAPRAIGLIGHSEGAVVAPLAASQSADVAFVVLLAGTAFPGEEILYQQGAAILKAGGASESALAAQKRIQQAIFRLMRELPDDELARPRIVEEINRLVAQLEKAEAQSLGDPAQFAASQADQVLNPWFRYFLTYDPRVALRKVTCPLLALNGEKDLQVLPKENLAEIRAVLAQSGHKDFEVEELPGLNHLFQPCKTGLPTEYGQIEQTMAPQVLDRIADWIGKRFATRE